MKNKEVDEIRWGSYREESHLSENTLNEALELFEKIDVRANGNDLVNWEERAALDQATKRSGRVLGSALIEEDENGGIDLKQAKEKNMKLSNDPKENELMEGLADIMGAMEGLDGEE